MPVRANTSWRGTRAKTRCEYAIGARIAVGVGVAEQAAGAVEQREIHAPGIDADAGQRCVELRGVVRHASLNLAATAAAHPSACGRRPGPAGSESGAAPAMSKRAPSHCPSITRPLDAPRSTARKLVVAVIPSPSDEGAERVRSWHSHPFTPHPLTFRSAAGGDSARPAGYRSARYQHRRGNAGRPARRFRPESWPTCRPSA